MAPIFHSVWVVGVALIDLLDSFCGKGSGSRQAPCVVSEGLIDSQERSGRGELLPYLFGFALEALRLRVAGRSFSRLVRVERERVVSEASVCRVLPIPKR
mgnify:CR=1 FL=1